ncbi:MAG: sulfatase-like hydrolase/transferase [Spirochaetales bacterium]
MGASRESASATALLLLSFLVINAALSTYVWAPVGAPALMLVPLPETLILFWILVLLAPRAHSSRLARMTLWVTGAVLGILVGFALAESFFRFYYARPFLPRSDIGMIRGALLLFLEDRTRFVDILTPLTIASVFLVLCGLGIGIVLALSRLARAARKMLPALASLSAVALPIMLGVGLPASLFGFTVSSWTRSDRIEFQSIEVDGVEAAPRARDVPEYALPGLLDRDIYFFAVEGYGYATVARPEISELIEPYRERFYEALRGRGYEVRSSYLTSPVAGGYSWLAEATILTGQWIDSQERFLQLYDADIAALPRMLYDAGYHTITFRPGTVHGSWPEAWDLYGFREAMVAHDGDFDFVGPWFSYVPITDQFALWAGHNRLEAITSSGGVAEQKPMLAWWQLVSSHTPFNRIPPVIEDWQALGNGQIYNERVGEIETFDNTWTGGTELVEGYVAAIGYVFEVLTKYVEELLDTSRNPIIVVFGDHQPQRPIRSPNAHLSVPIHVASRDQAILDQFARRGYTPGMVGTAPPPHPGMDIFFPMLVELARAPAEAAREIAD